MHLSHKYTILQMMHVSGHKIQKTFIDYIKLSPRRLLMKSPLCPRKWTRCGKT